MMERMGQLEQTREVVSGWAELRPDDNLVALGVIQRLVWSGRLAQSVLERAAVASGLRRRGDYELVALLRRVEPTLLTAVEVTRALAASASGLTGKIDRLEDQGMIERQSDPMDRRAVRLALTEKGRSVADEAFSLTLELYRRIVDRLGEEDLDKLDSLLESILGRLDELVATRTPWDA